MQLHRELIAPDPEASFRFHCRREPSFGFSWHHHREYELTCIAAGHGTRFVGDAITPYAAWDLVLLGPDLPHSWWAPGEDGGEQLAYCAQFDRDRLAAVLSAPEGHSLAGLLERAHGGLVFEASAAQAIGDRLGAMVDAAPLPRLGLLLECLGRLAGLPAQPISASALPTSGDHRIDHACRCVLERIDRPIAQGEIAAAVGLSPAAFARFFKRHTGRTLTDYIHQLRVTRACDRLRGSRDGIADIAFEVGFGNLANFNRIFKRLRGMTPRDYRRRWRVEPGA